MFRLRDWFKPQGANEQITLKNADQLDKMRTAGRMTAAVHDWLEDHVVAGVSTWDLDRMAEEYTRKLGGIPAFKGYRGYPATLCVARNEVIVHGIPNRKEVLREGDILGIDLGVIFEGYYGDSARTHRIGKVTPQADRLCRVTEECLYRAIDVMAPEVRLGDVGWAIESHAKDNGFAVVTEYTGHGVGRNLHEAPSIPHVGPPGKRERLKVGMVVAIEPMINQRGPGTKVLGDGWTVTTTDGGWSAHYEHTIAIVPEGNEVLTRSEKHPDRLSRD